jgi:hypothetical protein
MRKISLEAKKVLDALTKDLQHVGDHKKLENKPFMPLSIEIVDTYGRDEGLKISLCHYGEQNGDLMRDPEICLIKSSSDGNYYPYYYRNDYMGVEQFPVKFDPSDGSIQGYRRGQQREIAIFMGQWCENLKAQGFLTLKKWELCKNGRTIDIAYHPKATPAIDVLAKFREIYGESQIDIPGVVIMEA